MYGRFPAGVLTGSRAGLRARPLPPRPVVPSFIMLATRGWYLLVR